MSETPYWSLLGFGYQPPEPQQKAVPSGLDEAVEDADAKFADFMAEINSMEVSATDGQLSTRVSALLLKKTTKCN